MITKSSDLGRIAEEKLQEFERFCADYSLAGRVRADHLGFKCKSKEDYEVRRALFELTERFVYQSIIGGRRICIIGLSTGLHTSVGTLEYLELSDQKPDGSQVDAIDHLEIIPLESYESLVEELKGKGVAIKEVTRPHHTTYDIILPSGFVVKLSRELLLDKIKREEMV